MVYSLVPRLFRGESCHSGQHFVAAGCSSNQIADIMNDLIWPGKEPKASSKTSRERTLCIATEQGLLKRFHSLCVHSCFKLNNIYSDIVHYHN